MSKEPIKPLDYRVPLGHRPGPKPRHADWTLEGILILSLILGMLLFCTGTCVYSTLTDSM